MAEIYVSKEHFTNKPDCSGRSDTEAQVYELLERLKIPYLGTDHDEAPTIEACHEVEKELGILPCKNLFLRNRQKTTFFLLLMPGEKKFFTKDLSSQLGISRLSFAEPEFLDKYLGLTPGSISVLGLMNDKDWYVDLLIDRELLDNEYLGCHPCINTASLKIKTNDILTKFLKYTGHRHRVVTL